MARPCNTCEHASRDDIEKALRAGDRPSVIATHYPDLTEGSIRRHGQHMEETTGDAIIVRTNTESALQNAMNSSGLIAELSTIYASAQAVGTYAMNRGNEQTTLKALQTQLSVIDSVRKLSESERGADEAVANAGAADDLRRLVSALKIALPAHPQAGEAIAEALEQSGEWHAAASIRQLIGSKNGH